MPAVEYKTGDRFEFVYPFARDTYRAVDEDEDGSGYADVPTWKVGVRHADKGEGDIESIADGLGRCVVTVVSTHKPGKYPTRVFFTRTWIAPDGKAFGKTKCRMTTAATFKTLVQGYRHEFVLAGCSCEGCRWPHCDHRYGDSLASMESAMSAGAVDPVGGSDHEPSTRV